MVNGVRPLRTGGPEKSDTESLVSCSAALC